MKSLNVPEFRRSVMKQSWERIVVEVDFSDRLPPYFGSIQTATISAEKWPISSPSSVVNGSDILPSMNGVITPPNLSIVKVSIQGGDINFDYHVTCRATTTDGQQLEQDLYVRIRER